jgi:lipopolysaccharide/colanic/teichoic acid biosynthesis glycosyltransferase
MSSTLQKTLGERPFRPLPSQQTHALGVGDLLQRLVASLLILLYSPLFLVVCLLVLITLGHPVLYRGERLGANKRRFTMYKFRTMAEGAERLVGGDVVSESYAKARGLVSRFGTLLRNSRLDELPQLFNIAKGDMAFIGPRPERPQVYEKWCRDIPDYDQRFRIKPGLVGFSQVITPHNTPKRIRAIIDNRSASGRFGVGRHLRLLLLLIGGVAYHLGADLYRSAQNFWQTSPLLGGKGENRKYQRRSAADILFTLDDAGGAPTPGDGVARLLEISEEAVVIASTAPLGGDDLRFHISKRISRGRRARPVTKTARCAGEIVRRWPSGDASLPYAQAILYVAASPLNNYKIYKYFLREGIA